MDEVRGPTEGHPLQGPHRDLSLDVPAGFQALHLVLAPSGARIEVRRPSVMVGRHSSAEVRLALPDISRRHCQLIFESRQWRVVDLQSLNGLFVNGERMQEATLYHGDHLRLGPYTFVVEHALPAVTHEVLQSIADAMKDQRWAS